MNRSRWSSLLGVIVLLAGFSVGCTNGEPTPDEIDDLDVSEQVSESASPISKVGDDTSDGTSRDDTDGEDGDDQGEIDGAPIEGEPASDGGINLHGEFRKEPEPCPWTQKDHSNDA